MQRQQQARPRTSGRQSRVEGPRSARSQNGRTSDRHHAVLMIDTEDLDLARGPNGELPQPRNRTDGYGAAEDGEWVYNAYPITRDETEAWWNSWGDCHLNMKQWILNQRRLKGHLGVHQVQVNIWDPPMPVARPRALRARVTPRFLVSYLYWWTCVATSI